MKTYSKLILNTLIDKYEKSSLYKGDNTKSVKISLKFEKNTLADYFNEYKSEYKKEINEECLSLEDKGYIEIHWRKFQEGNIIEKVSLRVERLEEIYKDLKRTGKRDLESNAVEILSSYCSYENWLGFFARDMKSSIEAKSSVKKYIDIENPESISEIMYALEKIIEQKTEIPKRVFSAQYFNDSKKLERIESKLIRIMVDYGGYSSDVDVLAEANIIKNPAYVYMKGAAILDCNGEVINLNNLRGEIGLSSNVIDNLEVKAVDAKRIITIENLTTFHTYVPDNELIIYLGGYHNEVRRKLLKKIHEVSNDIPFYHWGDIDLGGFRVFNHLMNKTDIPFKSLFMDKTTLIKYEKYVKRIEDEKYVENLRKALAESTYQEFAEVIEYMIDKKIRLEQEVI